MAQSRIDDAISQYQKYLKGQPEIPSSVVAKLCDFMKKKGIAEYSREAADRLAKILLAINANSIARHTEAQYQQSLQSTFLDTSRVMDHKREHGKPFSKTEQIKKMISVFKSLKQIPDEEEIQAEEIKAEEIETLVLSIVAEDRAYLSLSNYQKILKDFESNPLRKKDEKQVQATKDNIRFISKNMFDIFNQLIPKYLELHNATNLENLLSKKAEHLATEEKLTLQKAEILAQKPALQQELEEIELSDDLAKVNKKINQLQQTIDLLDEQLEDKKIDSEQQNKLLIERASLQKEINNINASDPIIAKLKKTQASLDSLNQKVDNLDEQIALAKTNFERVEEHHRLLVEIQKRTAVNFDSKSVNEILTSVTGLMELIKQQLHRDKTRYVKQEKAIQSIKEVSSIYSESESWVSAARKFEKKLKEPSKKEAKTEYSSSLTDSYTAKLNSFFAASTFYNALNESFKILDGWMDPLNSQDRQLKHFEEFFTFEELAKLGAKESKTIDKENVKKALKLINISLQLPDETEKVLSSLLQLRNDFLNKFKSILKVPASLSIGAITSTYRSPHDLTTELVFPTHIVTNFSQIQQALKSLTEAKENKNDPLVTKAIQAADVLTKFETKINAAIDDIGRFIPKYFLPLPETIKKNIEASLKTVTTTDFIKELKANKSLHKLDKKSRNKRNEDFKRLGQQQLINLNDLIIFKKITDLIKLGRRTSEVFSLRESISYESLPPAFKKMHRDLQKRLIEYLITNKKDIFNIEESKVEAPNEEQFRREWDEAIKELTKVSLNVQLENTMELVRKNMDGIVEFKKLNDLLNDPEFLAARQTLYECASQLKLISSPPLVSAHRESSYGDTLTVPGAGTPMGSENATPVVTPLVTPLVTPTINLTLATPDSDDSNLSATPTPVTPANLGTPGTNEHISDLTDSAYEAPPPPQPSRKLKLGRPERIGAGPGYTGPGPGPAAEDHNHPTEPKATPIPGANPPPVTNNPKKVLTTVTPTGTKIHRRSTMFSGSPTTNTPASVGIVHNDGAGAPTPASAEEGAGAAPTPTPASDESAGVTPAPASVFGRKKS